MSNGPDDLLTTEQAAELLQLSPRTLRRWRTEGKGPPYIRLGARRVRYRRGAILDWARAHEQEAEQRADE
jgi:excisionase family DNA binding protein